MDARDLVIRLYCFASSHDTVDYSCQGLIGGFHLANHLEGKVEAVGLCVAVDLGDRLSHAWPKQRKSYCL